ncbi:uncharacterized protein LOC121053302 isoform X1 [Oryza brachyantha]|uniref:uncharacterized protein LOC121053302 isoform X1 n=1 Tax=Oryza brachyantha TaxID=4533 RepID=UPI001ADB2607|nr:uncharacterized protein LOC121053302 isoform X1 [Oryza brachyantha]
MNPRSTLMCGLHTSDALCPRSMLLRGLHAGVPLRLNGCFATPMPLFCSPGGHGNISDTAGSHNGGDARGGSSCSVFTRALPVARAKKIYQSNPHVTGFSNTIKTTRINGKKSDQDKIYTRCSPAISSDLFLDLGEQHKELVKEMGFDG